MGGRADDCTHCPSCGDWRFVKTAGKSEMATEKERTVFKHKYKCTACKHAWIEKSTW